MRLEVLWGSQARLLCISSRESDLTAAIHSLYLQRKSLIFCSELCPNSVAFASATVIIYTSNVKTLRYDHYLPWAASLTWPLNMNTIKSIVGRQSMNKFYNKLLFGEPWVPDCSLQPKTKAGYLSDEFETCAEVREAGFDKKREREACWTRSLREGNGLALILFSGKEVFPGSHPQVFLFTVRSIWTTRNRKLSLITKRVVFSTEFCCLRFITRPKSKD